MVGRHSTVYTKVLVAAAYRLQSACLPDPSTSAGVLLQRPRSQKTIQCQMGPGHWRQQRYLLRLLLSSAPFAGHHLYMRFQCLAGIGKALAMRLADQGVNVVLVAKPDSLLDDTHAEMQSTYKNLQVRKASINQGHI